MPRLLPGSLLAVLALASCFELRADTQAFGAPLSAATPVRIGELLRNPQAYVDRLVKVEGLVDDVCPAKGCWMDIIAAQSSEIVRFKVEDDVIVFPARAKGEQVVAEGVLRKHELSHAAAVRWMRHLAEEKGEAFDESSVVGPMSFYQIEGQGAVIGAAE